MLATTTVQANIPTLFTPDSLSTTMSLQASKGTTIYTTLGVPAPFDATCSLVTSPLFSPLALGLIRLTLAVYGTVFIVFSLVYDTVKLHTGSSFFSYFTMLSYIGLLSYFWASSVQTLAFAYSRSRSRHSYPLQHWPRPLQFLHLLLHSTITTFPILVTAIYWSLLSSPTTFSTRYHAWVNISEHALNTVFAAFEILLTNVAPRFGGPDANAEGVGAPWVHVPFLIALLACYLGLAYVTKATQGFYTYDFLDPHLQHAKLAAYIVGIAVGATVVFIIVRYLCMLRYYVSLRLAPDATRYVGHAETTAPRLSWASQMWRTKGGEEGGQVNGEALDEWEDVERPSETGIAI
ncbi:hypothetical protein BDW22DRAFT_607093 [Trametopsis cervina]|nr:hypothetical protein BDW22DRAFT_607093 [Trametopsis cervina]